MGLALLLITASTASAEWQGGIEGGTEIRESGAATRLTLTLSNNVRPLSHHISADWIRDATIGGRRLELDNIFGNDTVESEALGVLRAGASISLLGAVKLDTTADIAGSADRVDGITEAGISVLIPGGSLRYAVQSRWLNIDGGDTTRVSESFISYGYRF